MMLHEAIYQLNNTIVTIRNDIGYDANGNEVPYNKTQAEEFVKANEYKVKRALEYPAFTDYLDGIVKGDQVQIQAYIDACKEVKAKYPKGE